MEKTLSIIYLNGFRYGVDKEAKEKGKWEIIEDQVNLLSDDVDRTGFLIVASDDPSLGLPPIPQVEDDAYELGKQYALKNGHTNFKDLISQWAVRDYAAGYEAAKVKRYSEEDIRYAFIDGALEMIMADENTTPNDLFEQKGKECLQSLHPKPKQMVIEMEHYWGGFQVATTDNSEEFHALSLKLDSNGYVIVKQWII